MGATGVKRLDVGEVLSSAFDLYGDHWKTLVGFAAIVSGFGALLNAIVVELGLTGLILSLVLFLPSIIVSALLSGMFTVLIADVRDGVQDKSFGEIFAVVVPKLVPLILTSILVGLAVILGFVLLIIPGIIALVWFYLSSVVVVLEDKYYTDAMGRSRELVSGFFWPALGLGIITILIAAITQGIIGGVVGAIFSGTLGAFIGTTLAGAIVQPFTASVPVLAYYQLSGEDADPNAGIGPATTHHAVDPGHTAPPVTGTPESSAYTPPPAPPTESDQ
jgi:hypothetical protein